MSKGEDRVRVKFNPSADGVVDLIKQRTAALIDLVDEVAHLDPRCAALAQTAYEKAKVELDRVTGTTLELTAVSIDDAKSGVVTQMP